MPQSIEPAAPETVMPRVLCTAFQASRDWTTDTNTYANGEYQRNVPLVFDPLSGQTNGWTTSRKSWQLTERLTSAQWNALIQFWRSVNGCQNEFWFYDPYETVPPFSYDSTGALTSGRFTVRFNGNLNMAIGMGRPAQANLTLLEVA